MSKLEKENQVKIARLRKMHRKFNKEKDVRGIIRVKALIAYYKETLPSVIAQCYEINEKTLKNWIERFENEESLNDLPRSGRPSK
jgi:transposase